MIRLASFFWVTVLMVVAAVLNLRRFERVGDRREERWTFVINMSLLLVLGVVGAFVLFGCRPTWDLPRQCKIPVNAQQYDADYPVRPTRSTPAGFPLDDSGEPANDAKVDRVLAAEADACLLRTFPGGVLPPDVVTLGHCAYDRFELPAHGCVAVKVVASTDQQTIEGDYGDVTDEATKHRMPCDPAKGTAAGPCYLRAGREGTAVVSTRNMRLAKGPYIQIVTGCSTPWNAPALAACAEPSPTTEQNRLDDGTGP